MPKMTRQEINDYAILVVNELTESKAVELYHVRGDPLVTVPTIRLTSILELAMCRAADVAWGPTVTQSNFVEKTRGRK